MQLQSLGYVGIRTADLDQWAAYGTRFLGMQLVDQSRGALAFRMDDRKQRVIVQCRCEARASTSMAGKSPMPPRSMRWRRIWKNPGLRLRAAHARSPRSVAFKI